MPRRPAALVLVRPALLVALLAAQPSPRPAHAGDPEVDGLVEQARREKAALRYAEGLAILDRALRLGKSRPAELIAIHRLAGEMAAGLDDGDAAVAHFRRLLALAPDTSLPDGTSPKVTGPFAVAAAEIRERGPLRIRFRALWDRTPRVEVSVDGDPAGLAVSARATVRIAGGPPATVDAPLTAGRALLELPAGRALTVIAAALDAHGNAVAIHGSVEAPITLAPPPGAARPPLYARWWPWATASLLLAAGSTWAGLAARGAQTELDDIAAGRIARTWEHTQALERRGRRAALLANLGFAGAGATALLAAYLYVRERRSTGAPSMAIGAGDGALTFSVAGRF